VSWRPESRRAVCTVYSVQRAEEAAHKVRLENKKLLVNKELYICNEINGKSSKIYNVQYS
jgi:hypothetical protein